MEKGVDKKKSSAAILDLKLPFNLTKDQLGAVEAWINSGYRGSVIYSTGTGKTEIAFECARRRAQLADNKILDKSDKLTNINNNSVLQKKDSSFNLLYLVPRIVLIEQTFSRLLKYNVTKDQIGVYFGERKEVREITISTYQSVLKKLEFIRSSEMIIFDEVHLLPDSAITLNRIFDVIKEEDLNTEGKANRKSILGLTATIDESDPNYTTILNLIPPVKKYAISEAVRDGRLAKPLLIPIKVTLTSHEKKIYDDCSSKIKNISYRLNVFDAKKMSLLLRKGGSTTGLARAWFANVRIRKNLINSSENKLKIATTLISKKHPSERIMVFSETLDSLQKLKDSLEKICGIKSVIIESKLRLKERQSILSRWGIDFYPLLSVHTLEIGYDVPEVKIAVILATTSNINQVVQRIGRVLRKVHGNDEALIYTIYVSDTYDDNVLSMVKQATQTSGNEKKKKLEYTSLTPRDEIALDKFL